MTKLNSPSEKGSGGPRKIPAVTLVATGVVAAMCALSGTAQAQSAVGPVATPSDGSLTYKGITLYGIVDVGVQYMQHGAPFSDFYMASSSDIVQKYSNHSATGLTSSNLSQSRIGLMGIEPLGVGDVMGVFRVETYFNPSSGNLSDALKSVTQNNGRSTAANCGTGTNAACQTTNLDSSIAGELFGQAYVGLSSATYGSLTFGRQNTLLADGISKYDPNGASQAFSLIGLSGTAAGGGDTQDRRLDSSLKYVQGVGPIHFAGQYKFSQSYGGANTAIEADIGTEMMGLSVDAYYVYIRDAIAAGPLSAAQLAIATAAPNYLTPDKAVSGTVSDNTSWELLALYNVPGIALKLYGGYEYLWFKNPNNPLGIGFDDIGGYKLGAVNNNAYAHERILQVYWAGAKYTVAKQLDLTAAYYGYHQSAYATGALAGCESAVQSGACSGHTAVASFDADYRWTKRFDTYAGLMWSKVYGGQANGYFFATDSIDPTIGFRFRF